MIEGMPYQENLYDKSKSNKTCHVWIVKAWKFIPAGINVDTGRVSLLEVENIGHVLVIIKF